MPTPLRILLMGTAKEEDRLLGELERGGYEIEARRAARRAGLVRELDAGGLDLILAAAVPGLSAPEILDIARNRCPEAPVILFCDRLGEAELELVHRGAADCVPRDDLRRLGAATERALRRTRVEVDRKRLFLELRQTAVRSRMLLDVHNAVVGRLRPRTFLEGMATALRPALALDALLLALPEDTPEQLRGHLALINGTVRAQRVSGPFPLESGRLRDLIDRRAGGLCEDLDGGRTDALEELLAEAGMRAYAAAPLVGEVGPLGLLVAAATEPGAYVQADALFLKQVAEQVSPSVANLVAFRQLDVASTRLAEEARYLQEEDRTRGGTEGILGTSPGIRRAMAAVESVAGSAVHVLITGEPGTGKKHVARALHQLGPRREHPFIRVNCACIEPEAMEGELFGQGTGPAGVERETRGRFHLARGGTLYLQEVAEVPIDVQAELLDVLRHGTFTRVGSGTPEPAQVRIVASTNRDLEAEIEAGRFLPELYTRLAVYPVAVPPLRDRRGDIPAIVRHVQNRLSRRLGMEVPELTARQWRELREYAWPGNVRELESVVERAMIRARAGSPLEFLFPDRPDRREIPQE